MVHVPCSEGNESLLCPSDAKGKKIYHPGKISLFGQLRKSWAVTVTSHVSVGSSGWGPVAAGRGVRGRGPGGLLSLSDGPARPFLLILCPSFKRQSPDHITQQVLGEHGVCGVRDRNARLPFVLISVLEPAPSPTQPGGPQTSERPLQHCCFYPLFSYMAGLDLNTLTCWGGLGGSVD